MATVKNAQNHPRLYFNSATPRNRVTEYWVPELGVDSMFKRFDNRYTHAASERYLFSHHLLLAKLAEDRILFELPRR